MTDDHGQRIRKLEQEIANHKRIWLELPAGADKEDVPLLTEVVRMVTAYRRLRWLTRVMLVQIPLILVAVSAIYGAYEWFSGSGVYEWISRLLNAQ